MKRYLSLVLVAMIAAGVFALSGRSLAAEGEPDEEGFSAYSVARLKIFQGTVWVRSPDTGEWEESITNAPITERTRLNVPQGSEAELQFHGGQFVLLTEGTEIDVRKFDQANTVLLLRSGEVRFDLPADDFSPVRMMIPGGGKVDLNVPGKYWLSVGEDGQSRLVVRSGEGVVSLDKGDVVVKAGEEAAIGKDVRVSAYRAGAEDTAAAPPPLTEEEKKAEVPPAAAYELREYGDWVYSADYGWVWQPRTTAGWSPYYYGRWAWVSPYGWTWVSYEPWGWYPYHYGWWYSDPFYGWVWCPFRSFVSVSFMFGHTHFTHFHGHTHFHPSTVRFVREGRSVRWVPLRPGERFVRSGFTRSDARLGRWERPLDRGAVLTRTERAGKTEWREWTSTQRGRQSVQVRERSTRPSGETVRSPAPATKDRPAVRAPVESPRPQRQERVQPRPRSQDIRERTPQRGQGTGGDRPALKKEAPARWRQESGSASRYERTGPPRQERRVMNPSPRVRESQPSRGPQLREVPVVKRERVRPEPSAGSFAPNRSFMRQDGGGGARMQEGRGGGGRQVFGDPSSGGRVDRGSAGGGSGFGGRGAERGGGGRR